MGFAADNKFLSTDGFHRRYERRERFRDW